MAQRFKDAGWFEFFTTFQGHDEQVSMIFAQNFDGFEVVIGKLLMMVTEHSIARACKLPIGGERWWKKEHVVMEFVNQFLLPEKHNPNWKKGVPHSWIRKEWHIALIIIHRYITCEGRFSLVYIYHIRLLMHINGDYPLNLPYFLLKSLSKMSKRVQSHPATAKGSLFHQVLIKTLVVSSLKEVQRPWDWLIQSLNNDPQPSKSKKSKGKRSTTQKQSVTVDESPIKEETSATRITRATTRSSKVEALFKGTGGISDDKDYHPEDSDQIPDIPEAMESDSSDDDHSSELSSRYQIKLREPKAAIDLNKPAPAEEFPEFKVKVRSDKDKIKELLKMVKQ
jgi:hypothetical protein